jgi:hypothetical protein
MLLLNSSRGGYNEDDVSKNFRQDDVYYYIDGERYEKSRFEKPMKCFGGLLTSIRRGNDWFLIPSDLFFSENSNYKKDTLTNTYINKDSGGKSNERNNRHSAGNSARDSNSSFTGSNNNQRKKGTAKQKNRGNDRPDKRINHGTNGQRKQEVQTSGNRLHGDKKK